MNRSKHIELYITLEVEEEEVVGIVVSTVLSSCTNEKRKYRKREKSGSNYQGLDIYM